jgi:hypothetical protein
MNQAPTKSIFFLIVSLIVVKTCSSNRYTSLKARIDDHQSKYIESLYNPYYFSMRYFQSKPYKTLNYFREIILPFTSEAYRVLTTAGNTYFEISGVDPITILSIWENSSFSKTYHFLKYVTNSDSTVVYHICNENDKCYTLQIEKDIKKYTRNAWREVSHLRKEKFILHLRKTIYKQKFLFAIFQYAPTSLEDLIEQEALKEMHKINLTFDLLSMMENFMKYKIVHGDIRPTKILALIDSKTRKSFKDQLKWQTMVNHHTEIDPVLSGFKKHARLTNREGKLFSDEVYENGKGKIDMTDLNEPRKPKIIRYDKKFRPYEIWAYKYKKFGPGSDIFALGITLTYLVLGKGPNSLESGCSGKSLYECKQTFIELENEIHNEISHCFGWERCVLYLVSKMTVLSPIERISPKNAKKDFVKCLHKLGFDFEEPPKV